MVVSVYIFARFPRAKLVIITRFQAVDYNNCLMIVARISLYSLVY
jgi:hypothetical protein